MAEVHPPNAQHTNQAEQQVDIIRAAYMELGNRVQNAVRTQIGDQARLSAQQRSASHFLDMVSQRRQLFIAEDYINLETGILNMLDALEAAWARSHDHANAPIVQTTRFLYTGKPGRPRKIIDPDFLLASLQYRGPTHLAPVFDCSPRTVRRRALEYGFAEPCPPVYVTFEDPATGQRLRFYRSSMAPVSQLSDAELDSILTHILAIFPAFGRRMITGHLRHLGHNVPRQRLQSAYERVMGAPANLIAPQIERRVYKVAGPNSLWHHDGQHGLIRYGIVIHAFVDGFSCLVTAIQASTNNHKETVLRIFLDACEAHGIPSRVRGDHGVENLAVAAYMEENFGVERGSYIWGR